MVTTFESVFDIIMMVHQKIGHAHDVKKNKDTVNDDLIYYGVPRVAVKCFVDTSPMVSKLISCCVICVSLTHIPNLILFALCSQCVGNIRLTKQKQQPLKMILNKNVGSHYQMDLIEMPPIMATNTFTGLMITYHSIGLLLLCNKGTPKKWAQHC
jgi:hypothetical protein